MNCIIYNEIIDQILDSHKSELGKYFDQYRNHVYRVYNFAIPHISDIRDLETLAIAAAFHDLGIWTSCTFDYLKPSIALAKQYSIDKMLDTEIILDIEIIIDSHHKLTKEKTSKLAEIFRQADLVDLSLGLIRKGRDWNAISSIKKTFPNKGFHLFLLKLFLKNLFINPLRPLPMYKF